jgi:predicted aldo/keto reductase-like oxidoreductase
LSTDFDKPLTVLEPGRKNSRCRRTLSILDFVEVRRKECRTDESQSERNVMNISRRNFLKKTSSSLAFGVAAGQSILRPIAAAAQAATETSEQRRPLETRSGDMLYRTLGRTKEKVSVIGLGGYHIGKSQLSDADSIKIIRSAIDHGITFMDNGWDYNDGNSEIRMGKALREVDRQKIFLMTKIDGRTKQEAARQLDESLKRLQTDHIDLLQHHEVIRADDPDRIFAEGGAQEAMLEAQKAGKIRYIGFTGHKDPFFHLRMLDTAAKNHFHFDAVQMPLNVMDSHFRSFEDQVLPVLLKDDIGVAAMKTFGDNYILRSKIVGPMEALHYSMTLPTSVIITGIDSLQVLDQAIEAARTFKPMTKEEIAALLGRTREAALKGQFELYKISQHFDGTARNPQWLG